MPRNLEPPGWKTLLAIAVAAIAVTAHALDEASAEGGERATPDRGDFAGQIDIGDGRKLYLSCKGKGSPTVILESGIHDSSDTWTLSDAQPPVLGVPAVFPGVAKFTRVCRYDRPGTIRDTDPPSQLTTRSSPVEMPRTLPGMAGDLHALLANARLPGPYVLVGHSFGGMIVRLFAQTHPSEAAGLVLVDAFGATIRGRFGAELWPAYVELLNHPGTPLDDEPGFETIDIDGAIDAVAQAPLLPRIPLAVMSKSEPFATAPGAPEAVITRLEQVWPEVQADLVGLEPQTPHVVATGSDHYVQVNDPDLTIAVIRLVVDRARRAR